MSDKVNISNVLKEPRDWVDIVDEKFPEAGQQVVIRICHDTAIYGEDNMNRYPMEDVKIGVYEDGKWSVSPPFPKYDFSELTQGSELNDYVHVTHWAIPEDGEINGWNTRFDMIGSYKKLNIEVDSENEKDVYRALMFGGSFIARFGGEEFHNAKSGEGLKKLYEILCDLQACIDASGNSNSEE